MELLLTLVGLSLLLELASLFAFRVNLFQPARITSAVNVAVIMFIGSVSLSVLPIIFSSIIMLLSIYRVVNVGRLIAGRQQKQSIERKVTRSSIELSLILLILILLGHLNPNVDYLNIALWLSMTGAVLLFFNTVFSIKRWSVNRANETNSELPTVSICIPARNETQDLPECIESMLASTYPKLEVLVLDDCSHDKTPQIIKKYAHSGVRFIPGNEPSEDWLAKNKALNKLFDESMGEIVIFAGVDVRFERDSVSRIVAEMDSDTKMVSILPWRSKSHEASLFIQPLRYWWELAVPRFRKGRPPVLSTCWAIKREALESIGEFDSVKRSVQPERHFANKLKSAYKFIMSNNRMGVTSLKSPRDQFDTALRVRYPQASRRPEAAFGVTLLELLIFITPLVGVFYGEVILSLIILTLLALTNVLITRLVVRKSWMLGLVSTHILVIEDIYLLNRSMIAYEFGVVKWKERNICLPMLQVEKNLPKLKE